MKCAIILESNKKNALSFKYTNHAKPRQRLPHRSSFYLKIQVR